MFRLSRNVGAQLKRSRSIPYLPAGRPLPRMCATGTVDAPRKLVYEGPFGDMLRLLKRVSIFSCACTVVGVPLLAAFGNPKMSEVQRTAVGGTVCIFAIGTTATLHFVCKPYVLRILLREGTSAMEVHTLSIVGRTKETLVDMKEIALSGDRIFSTFQNKAGMPFYIHEERAMFGDNEFYSQIMKTLGLKEEPLNKDSDVDTQ